MKRRVSIIAVVCVAAMAKVYGDGGTLQFRRPAGPFVITVFSAPVPVRVGSADLSVMLERAADRSTVSDAKVMVHVVRRQANGIVEVTAPATHALATNKLLYAANVTLRSAGQWRVTVDVTTKDSSVSTAGDVTVLPAEPPAVAHWPYFALVPLMVLLFAANQWLKSKRQVRRRQVRP